MKQILAFLFCAITMASCSVKSYIQIVDVKSSLPLKSDSYVYSDDVCEITYDFWRNGGNPGFVMENLSDKTIYIDLGNSFFIKNGSAYDYFRNRTFTEESSSSILSSVSNTAAAYVISPVRVSSTATRMLSNGVSVKEKQMVAIPPHSYKVISEYLIDGEVLEDCSVKLFPKKNLSESITFDEANSPIKFTNYITYRVGENEASQTLTHEFYVGGYTNYNKIDVDQRIHVGCKNQLTRWMNKYADGKRYYVTYDSHHRNDFSADAKIRIY